MGFLLDAETSDSLAALCRKYGVKRLKLFGSATNEDFDPTASDLDFVVEFSPAPPGMDLPEQFFGFHDELRNLFNREIDLLEEKAIKNTFMIREVERNSVTVYAA